MIVNAIVKRPGRTLEEGITSANLGKPDYRTALIQHDKYIEALKSCGVKVTVLEADERFPDSVFIEDPAVLTEKCAVIANPGADSRKGEEIPVSEILDNFYSKDCIEHITAPGTLDGGDVMKAGNHFYVGLSARTNKDGFAQFQEILNKHGYTVSAVKIDHFLHLKSGLSYLEHGTVLVAGELVYCKEFDRFNRIVVDESEMYAANSIWVNDRVLVPSGFSKTKEAVEKSGYKVIEVDVTEYRKLDGGLSCLSLRL